MRQSSGRSRQKSSVKISKSKKRKSSQPVPDSTYKPTLLIDSDKLTGDSLRVGKQATVRVSGKIVEESLRNYEAEGRKSYRLEIAKIIAEKTGRKK